MVWKTERGYVNKTQLAKCVALCEAGSFKVVEDLTRKMIRKNKKDAAAYKALGVALWSQKKKGDLDALKKSVNLNPLDAQSWFNLARSFKDQGMKEEAVVCYNKAIILKPEYPEAYNNLGNTLKDLSRRDEALKAFWMAVRMAPHMVEIQLNLGNELFACGRHAEALRVFECAVAIKSDFVDAHNAMIFVNDLEPCTTAQSAYEQRLRWAEKFTEHLWTDNLHPNDPDPDRKLNIGYVSGDFREHSAARVFGGMILQADKTQFEIFCYHNSKHPSDSYTEEFKGAANHWRDISMLTDEDAAEAIRADEIDILVDLSGHTGGNRLLSFARKPAPIQVTAWGYVTGTGMRAMDYMFADPVLIPPDEQKYYAEKLRYLPAYGGRMQGEPFPDVNPLPALNGDGLISFGSLNRMAKMTPEGFQLWVDVLNAVPNSGLIIKAGELGDEQSREEMLQTFVKLGVDKGRLIVRGGSPWEDHMAAYNQIDIVLDTFPQTGGATTMEALMMGVPVVTLRHPTCAGRPSAAILTAIGLSDWIADTPADYVRIAKEKAANLERLSALRQNLRAQFLKSPVGDNVGYCRAVEKEYRLMWQEWCEKSTPGKKVLDKELQEA